MPIVDTERLHRLIAGVFEAAGGAADEAETVARHMVGANLAGHDSHGVQLLPTYVARVQRGDIVPGAPFEVLDETPATARVDGHWGFGQVVSERAMALAMAKAQAAHVAAVTVRQQAHVGRVADYPLMAARAGLIGIMFCDSGRTAKQVVPFGGREARLGTNPLCIALPSDLEAPVIIDKDGRPSTDPDDYTDGGALLPVGGTQGHKGYGLGFMIEVFTGILTGLGFGVDPSGRHNDGSLLLALNPGAFRPVDTFRAEVAAFARYVKETPSAAGVAEVYYPGELEWRTEQARRRDGIPIEEPTWAAVAQVAESFG